MNASRRLFVNVRSACAVACVLGCVSLGGCVERIFQEGAIDASSPVKDEIASSARRNDDFPSFNEVPVKPSDVRPVRAFGDAADKVIAAGAQLERDTAPSTWTLNGTDTGAFAASANRAAGPELPAVIANDADAYAAALRKRATPPPPPKR